MGQGIVNTKLHTLFYYLPLCHPDQGGVYPETLSLYPCLCSKVSHLLKGLYELRPAIRVSAVVQCVDSYEDIRCSQYLGPPEGYRKKNCVPGRDIGNWNVSCHLFGIPSFRNINIRGQGGTAELPQ